MGLKDSLITMMGEFVELKRNPEFRSRTDVSSQSASSSSSATAAIHNRRHSLNITVGTVESAPEKAIRQRTFSVSTESSAPSNRRRDSSDSASLKDTSGEDSKAVAASRYGNQSRRASEPFNFVPQWGSGRSGSNKKKKPGQSKQKRSPLAHTSSFEESQSHSSRSPPRRLPTSSEEHVHNEYAESPPRSPRSPMFKNSFSKFVGSPIEEDWEAEKIAAGTDISVDLSGGRKKRSDAANFTRF